jgi:hypothetical protein
MKLVRSVLKPYFLLRWVPSPVQSAIKSLASRIYGTRICNRDVDTMDSDIVDELESWIQYIERLLLRYIEETNFDP